MSLGLKEISTKMKYFYNFFTLFTSVSTLLCCALPALLVALGLGAAMAGFLSNHPELIWISQNKIWLFSIGGIMLAGGGFLQYKMKDMPCPINEKGEACADTRKTSKYIYIVSVIIYLIGFSFAYILPYI